MSEAADVVVARGLRKGYGEGERRVEVLRGLDVSVGRGEMVAVVGPSGVGKSTLLHLLGLLDRPDGGELHLFGSDTAELSVEERARWRNRRIGFVFQFHALLPEFTLEENVAMPLLIAGEHRSSAVAAAGAMIGDVGLADRRSHFPDELSGGEQQRGAVARALVAGPELLLADEPTGNLDAANAENLFGVLRHLHLSRGLTSVIVTHNEALAGRCGRTLRLTGAAVEETCSRT
ncbi:MAG TPA: ABC transporter ATP-binding protein [Thermoanaerobaculaceae bacterium]|nr:ABC transporter ATP-binding protein [Thermoanaerobaculaceae bacterium]